MKGGSRYGAGRPASHNKTESFHSIDIRRWAREGNLTPHNYFGWQWTRDEEVTASIGVLVDGPDSLTLKYTCSVDGGERKDVSFPIRLTRTPCYFGGAGRVWFICPHSGRRVAKLYCYRGRWYGRKALCLKYQSQSDDYVTRIHRRIEKLEAILEDRGPKKFLHQKTVDRLVKKWDDYERRLDIAFCERFGTMMGF